ncbi:MAG: glycosyltransferase [Candidatus Aminicenantes bacterium]|nr:glycosyltransferase [Candidatus Aminicenantes bacterium]
MNEKKIRVVLIGPGFPFRGGIAHYTTLLFENLKRTTRVTFYSFKRQYFQFLFPGKSDRDVSRYPISSSGMHRVLDTLNPISWIKTGRLSRSADLIIIPWWVSFWAPYYYVFLLFARTPKNLVFFLCHNVIEHETNPLTKAVTRFLLRKGDGFMVHSLKEKKLLQNIIGKKHPPVAVSPHPTYQIFDRAAENQVSARKKLDLREDQHVILFFGFIRKYKGLYYLIRALPETIRRLPDLVLLIVGECWEGEERYLELIRKLSLEKNVRFINKYVPNEDVEIYFKSADFVILPYVAGTGSGILQLSFGMEKPVIASRTEVFQDIVEENKTGLFAPPQNSQKLAEAILKMYDKNLVPVFTKNIRRNNERFSWEKMVESIFSLYDKGKKP